MARIYNFMPFDITVSPTVVFIPEGSITIPAGQRSDSIEWSSANAMSVEGAGGSPDVCTFDFGVHAQIQGGNYAIISPNSFLVYDSNHDVIATGSN
ncbi:MAG TPA: hypothetical protein VF719_08725 [Abditibacteriaceae bacterium]|jgi:hypothetical protein